MDETIREAHRLVEGAGRVAGLTSLYASFIDSAADAWVIVEVTPRGLIIALFNRKAVLLFGWQPEQVIGKPVEMLLPEALREIHSKVHAPGYVRDPYTRSMGAQLDLRALAKDGSTFPVVIDLEPQRSWDGILFVRAAIRPKPVAAAAATTSAGTTQVEPNQPNQPDRPNASTKPNPPISPPDHET